MPDSSSVDTETEIVPILREILAEMRTLTSALAKIEPLLDNPAARWALNRRKKMTTQTGMPTVTTEAH